MADLKGLLDAYDRVIASAGGLVGDRLLESVATVGRSVRTRRGFLGRTFVVALAGGTGSGKSSILNALAGSEIALTGPRRPTTEAALAWIPAEPEPGLELLLDTIGVERRVRHGSRNRWAVIDLPDTDSVEIGHRQSVDRLLPLVDVVIWVVDPEKYQDRVLHDDYLSRLAKYEAQLRFVMNQIDRVPTEDQLILLEDFRSSLKADGIDDPIIVATAVDPPLGYPRGLDELEHLLTAMEAEKQLVSSKLAADLEAGVEAVAAATGVGAGGLGLDPRWSSAVDVAVELLTRGAAAEAEHKIEELIYRLGDETTGAAAEAVTALDSIVGEAVVEALSEASLEVARVRIPRWWHPRRRRRARHERRSVLLAVARSSLDQSIGRRLREALRPRALLAAAVAEFRLLIAGDRA